MIVDLGSSNSACKWRVNSENSEYAIDATVPGDIHGDLIKAGLLKSIYYRDTHIKCRWIALQDWTYSLSLPPPLFPTLSPVTFDQQSTETKSIIFIEFDGLDTVAEIFFNGVKVGSSSNQFVQVRTDNLAPLLLTSENTIQVVFKSAVKFGQIQAEKYPYPVPDGFAPEQHGERNRNMVRKEQCSFSWDWGPCFATCGIWKSCRLVQLDDINTTFHVTRFSPDISWVNDVGSEEEKCFSIDVSVNMILAAKENNDSNQSCLAQVKLEIKGRPDLPSTTIKNVKPIPLKQGRQNHHHTKINLKIPCKLIQLWWPAGYGEQPLYTLQLTILPTTASSSEKKFTRRIGFRRIKLIQDPIPPIGTSFYFQVNGINIFAKGANFVPCHALESQVSVETLRLLLAASVEANMNMIRCWGGGIYQRDEFYELADELGLMVWQEYPANNEFLESVREEVTHQVSRLIHHPSIVIWSGNNENQEALMNGWYETTRKNPYIYTLDYQSLFIDTVMPAVLAVDGTRPFISTSPTNGLLFKESSSSTDGYCGRVLMERWKAENNDWYGDVHVFNYTDDGTDVLKFRRPRFASEFGFQSMPWFSTLKTVFDEKDMHPFSEMMVKRNHHKNGQEEMIYQMRMHFRLPFLQNSPEDKTFPCTPAQFDTFCTLTQLVGAIVIKAQAEHYRRLRGSSSVYCMGALYWQLNDIWEAPTWSSIEYGGRWKILHNYAKHFFAPVLVSSHQIDQEYHVSLSNDYDHVIHGVVRVETWSWETGKQTHVWSKTVKVNALDSQEIGHWSDICSLLPSSPSSGKEFLVVEASGENWNSINFYLPTRLKDITFKASRRPNIIYRKSTKDHGNSGTSSDNFTQWFDFETDWPTTFVVLSCGGGGGGGSGGAAAGGHFTDNGFALVPGRFKKIGWVSVSQVLEELDISINCDWDFCQQQQEE